MSINCNKTRNGISNFPMRQERLSSFVSCGFSATLHCRLSSTNFTLDVFCSLVDCVVDLQHDLFSNNIIY